MARLKPRHATATVTELLRSGRVIVVNGPRQAGKTTMVRDQVMPTTGGTYVTLDDERQLAACIDDPPTFLARPKPLIIDEFQRAGDTLLRAVKVVVDQDRTPGQFVLTGSTRFTTVPTISESLVGRVRIVDLWPFTQGEADELGPSADRFLEALLDPDARPTVPIHDAPTRDEYLRRVCRGGFPEVHRLDREAERRAFFRDYVRTISQRDVPELSRVQHVEELPRLLRTLASSSAQELNVSEVARAIGINRAALGRNYLPLLQTLYVTTRLPAWSRKPLGQVRRHPKIHFGDTGLAAHLLGVDATRLAEPTSPVTGAIVETFAVNEIVRQVSRFQDEIDARLFHYRTPGGVEVDAVIETADGRIAAVEVKASTTVRSRDFDHLRRLKARVDRLSDLTFVRGVVLYTGPASLSFGDGMQALPLATLWLPPDRP